MPAIYKSGNMETEKLKDLIIKLLDDKKAENIYVIDLSGKSSLAKYLVLANGRSSKNVSSMGEYVTDELKLAGLHHIRMEGIRSGDWALVDAGEVIVHIFHPEARSHYKLEELSAISKSELEGILASAFPNAIIEVKDLVGDSDHYSLLIKDKMFKDTPLIKQHRIVKDALKEILNTKLHAITIKTSADI